MRESAKTSTPSVLHTSSSAAREMKIPESTFRYYENAGKIRPVAVTVSGIRIYDPVDVKRLRDELEARE